MATNSIQQKERIDFYMDRSRNARFSFYQYAVAMRETQAIFFDKYKKDEQGIRENLYTLIKTATPTVTNVTTTSTYKIDRISYPSDYHFFLNMLNTISGALAETKSTNWNMWNDILIDSFRVPNNDKMYQLEDATGWLIARGTTGTLVSSLTYLMAPSDWSIGAETDLINAGVAVLTLGLSYVATEQSVQNGISYQPGVQFTAAVTTTLASGQVILFSKLVNSNLPDTVFEDVSKLCASVMQGTIKDYQGSQFDEKLFDEAQ